MSQTNARFPVFISTAHERFPRDGRRGSQKHALWLGLGRGCIRNSPATQSENNPESTCQPKWQLAVIAKIDDIERQVRKAELDAQRVVQAELEAIDTHVEQLGEVADVLARAIIIASGYHQHKGGEWRKYRERKPVV